MNKIKFSHEYCKLECRVGASVYQIVNSAELLQVFRCHYKDLGKNFIKLDTEYEDRGKFCYYELPKTELIVLIFRDLYTRCWFTTIRKYTPKKYKYYKSKMGEMFEVEIKEKNE